ncbi:MAG: FKBP-type peptidyl-prolyl cis-trans isomerase [Chitinophagaceae bacterium]
MKKVFLFLVAAGLYSITVNAGGKDSTIYYILPDSIKAVSFLAEISVKAVNTKKEVFTGIRSGNISIALESEKKEKEVVFAFPGTALPMTKGFDVNDNEKGEMEWKYDWSVNENYKLLLAVATDSAGNFSLYSGYIWLPKENKWKLIGTCKIEGQSTTLQDPAVFFPAQDNQPLLQVETGQVWLQRNNGSWKNLNGNLPTITVNLLSHTDSLKQLEKETQIIQQAIVSGKTDVKDNVEGVYYKIMKEGNGRQVSLNDTVTVYYKLNLFMDGSLVEETQDKPATFPLKRLIKGWQLGVPLCRIGGKIKLIIPSAMAYSIRTRAAKIPPNSILQFEIEVVDAKPPL